MGDWETALPKLQQKKYPFRLNMWVPTILLAKVEPRSNYWQNMDWMLPIL